MMPRTRGDSLTATRARGSASRRSGMVDKIAQIVAANEALRHEHTELAAQNERLKSELREISEALGRLTGNGRRRRGRGSVAVPAAQAKPRRRITDPAI